MKKFPGLVEILISSVFFLSCATLREDDLSARRPVVTQAEEALMVGGGGVTLIPEKNADLDVVSDEKEMSGSRSALRADLVPDESASSPPKDEGAGDAEILAGTAETEKVSVENELPGDGDPADSLSTGEDRVKRSRERLKISFRFPFTVQIMREMLGRAEGKIIAKVDTYQCESAPCTLEVDPTPYCRDGEIFKVRVISNLRNMTPYEQSFSCNVPGLLQLQRSDFHWKPKLLRVITNYVSDVELLPASQGEAGAGPGGLVQKDFTRKVIRAKVTEFKISPRGGDCPGYLVRARSGSVFLHGADRKVNFCKLKDGQVISIKLRPERTKYRSYAGFWKRVCEKKTTGGVYGAYSRFTGLPVVNWVGRVLRVEEEDNRYLIQVRCRYRGGIRHAVTLETRNPSSLALFPGTRIRFSGVPVQGDENAGGCITAGGEKVALPQRKRMPASMRKEMQTTLHLEEGWFELVEE